MYLSFEWMCYCGCSETICMITIAQELLWWFDTYIEKKKSTIWCYRINFVCVCVGAQRTIWHTNLVYLYALPLLFLSLKCVNYFALRFTKLYQFGVFKSLLIHSKHVCTVFSVCEKFLNIHVCRIFSHRNVTKYNYKVGKHKISCIVECTRFSVCHCIHQKSSPWFHLNLT